MKMIFNSHDKGILDEATAIVGSTKMLIHENTEYFPELVIIRESREYNTNIIRIEDLVEYATSNGITNGTQAIINVCEASDVYPSTVSLSLDEVNAYADQEMLDTAKQFSEAGFKVFLNPISKHDPVYELAESTFDKIHDLMQRGEEISADELMNAYLNDDFETLKEQTDINPQNKILQKLKRVPQEVSSNINDKEYLGKKMASMRNLYYSLRNKANGVSPTNMDTSTVKALMNKTQQAIGFVRAKLK
jgi:hypothetical protein